MKERRVARRSKDSCLERTHRLVPSRAASVRLVWTGNRRAKDGEGRELVVPRSRVEKEEREVDS